MIKKLTPKQKDIIRQMRDGVELNKRFSFYVGRGAKYYLGDVRVSDTTIASLIDKGFVGYKNIDSTRAITRHLYGLTELGETIEQ